MTAVDRFDGFVHVLDGRLVNGRGEPILMRGVGIGNWMLPEGYMWLLEPGPNSPRLLEEFVASLTGAEYAETFWDRFRSEYFTQDDVAMIAELGYDHVRLPINWRLMMDDRGAPIAAGVAMIDRTIEWCRDAGLWVILDLHGAPGGQTGANIDDSPNNLPELFTDPAARELNLAVWRFLAERYADDTVVAGYDLLNEPLPNEWQHSLKDELVAVYQETTAAIREIDQNHLVIYEGTHWATNWEIFTQVWDPNSMLQFHKYWSPVDRAAIAGYVEIAARLGLPLYMGEGGENDAEWLFTAFRLYEDHGISWNLWPWKKMETYSSPLSVRAPRGWGRIIEAGRGGARPSADEARGIFDEFLALIPATRCDSRQAVTAAVLGRVPVTIPSWGFGFRPGACSGALDRGGLPDDMASQQFRRDDGIRVVALDGRSGPFTFDHVSGRNRPADQTLAVVLTGEQWVEYDFETRGEARLRVVLQLSAPELGGAMPGVSIDGEALELFQPERRLLSGMTSGELGSGRHILRLSGPGSDAAALTWALDAPERNRDTDELAAVVESIELSNA